MSLPVDSPVIFVPGIFSKRQQLLELFKKNYQNRNSYLTANQSGSI